MPSPSTSAVGRPRRAQYHAAVRPPIPPPMTTTSQISRLRRSDILFLLLGTSAEYRGRRRDLLRDWIAEDAVVREHVRAVTRGIAGHDDHEIIRVPDDGHHA